MYKRQVNGLIATIIFNGLKVNADGENKSTGEIRSEVADRLKVRRSNSIIARAVQTSTTEASALGVQHELQQNEMPNWEWISVGDEHVRPEHVLNDGIIREIDTAFPSGEKKPGGFNCRCTIVGTFDEPTK